MLERLAGKEDDLSQYLRGIDSMGHLTLYVVDPSADHKDDQHRTESLCARGGSSAAPSVEDSEKLAIFYTHTSL